MVHQNPEIFQSNLTPSIDNLDRTKSEVALPDPKGAGTNLYADRVDPETNHIAEIKPHSEQAINAGLARNQTYEARLEAETGQPATSSLIPMIAQDFKPSILG